MLDTCKIEQLYTIMCIWGKQLTGGCGVPGAYSAIGAGYSGMALPLGYGEGHPPTYAPAMIPTRSLTAQAFHPYRRADDGR